MSRKYTGILIIIIGALLAWGFYYLLIGRVTTKNVDKKISNVLSPSVSEEKIDSPVTTTVPTSGLTSREFKNTYAAHKIGEEDLKKMAALFAERFGSYSNQSNFSNIEDLKTFMSVRMTTWADSYIAQQRKGNREKAVVIYYGITTKSILSVSKKIDDEGGVAEILVKTRRRESTMSANNSSKSFNQDISITFVKEGGNWKVDTAYWMDKSNN